MAGPWLAFYHCLNQEIQSSSIVSWTFVISSSVAFSFDQYGNNTRVDIVKALAAIRAVSNLLLMRALHGCFATLVQEL